MAGNRRTSFIVGSITVFLFCNACTKSNFFPKKNETEKFTLQPKDLDLRPKELTLGLQEKCSSFNPFFETKESCLSISTLFFPTLFRSQPNSSEPALNSTLAEKWNFETPHKLKITLRKDIHWSNGSPLHPSHFLLKWKQILSNPQLSHFAPLLFPVKNARNFFYHRVPFSQVGLKEEGSTGLEIELEEPDKTFMTQLSHVALSPEFPLAIPKTVPSLGLFKILSFHQEIILTLVPHLPFASQKTFFNKINIFFGLEETEALQQMKEGSLDFYSMAQNPTLEWGGLAAWKQINPSSFSLQLVLNPKKTIFSSRWARHRFLSAINKEEFLSLLKWPHKTKTSIFSVKNSPKDLPATLATNRKSEKDISPVIEKEEPDLLTLSYPSTQDAFEVAENIRAQWAKKLGASFEIVPDSEVNSTAVLVLIHQLMERDPSILRSLWNEYISTKLLATTEYTAYETHLLPWNQPSEKANETFEEWLAFKEFFVLPLLTFTRTIYINPNLRGFSQDPFFLWNLLDLQRSLEEDEVQHTSQIGRMDLFRSESV